jgi:anti-sigma B factor antagonist
MSTMDDSSFEVRRRDGEGEVVVEVRGELDIHSCPALDEVFGGMSSVDRVALDLSGVTFIDSAGLRSILQGQQAVAAAGGALVVRAPSAPTRRLFEITGLDDVLTIES